MCLVRVAVFVCVCVFFLLSVGVVGVLVFPFQKMTSECSAEQISTDAHTPSIWATTRLSAAALFVVTDCAASIIAGMHSMQLVRMRKSLIGNQCDSKLTKSLIDQHAAESSRPAI